MDYPDWLGTLNKRDEHRRAAAGLFPGRDGWYKKINGKKRYISKSMPLDDVLKILDARIDQITGKASVKSTPMVVSSTTILELAAMFQNHLWERHTTGAPRKLARRTYEDYVDVLARFCAVVGERQLAMQVNPDWFSKFARSIAKKAATTRRRQIIYITAFFNWAGPGRHSQNIYKEPVQFGPDFRKPDEGKLRLELAEHSTLVTPTQFQAALNVTAPCPLLYAVTLLGLNAAFLPIDFATITMKFIDLDNAVHTFPRGKNQLPRRCFLMPETVAAIRRYLKIRPPIESDDDLLFVDENGRPFVNDPVPDADVRVGNNNKLSRYWALATKLQLKGLRTTLATELDGSSDQHAIDLLMGHAVKKIRSKHYVKRFDVARIRVALAPLWKQYVFQVPRLSGELISPARLALSVSPRRAASSKRQLRAGGSGSAVA